VTPEEERIYEQGVEGGRANNGRRGGGNCPRGPRRGYYQSSAKGVQQKRKRESQWKGCERGGGNSTGGKTSSLFGRRQINTARDLERSTPTKTITGGWGGLTRKEREVGRVNGIDATGHTVVERGDGIATTYFTGSRESANGKVIIDDLY